MQVSYEELLAYIGEQALQIRVLKNEIAVKDRLLLELTDGNGEQKINAKDGDEGASDGASD